jgi:hypothetical protein
MKHTHTLAKEKPKAKEVGEGYLPQQPYALFIAKTKD